MALATRTLPPFLMLLSIGCATEVGSGGDLTDEEARGCPSDGNSCTSDAKVHGKCLYQPLPDGSSCDVGGVCSAGTCELGESNPAEVGVGETTTCARYSGGEVYCWGTNCEGGLGAGAPIDCSTIYGPTEVLGAGEAVDLTVGDEHSCAVRPDSTAVCWGWNVAGALGDGTAVDRASPVAVAGLSGIAKMAAGRTHTCAVLQSGEVACWGDNFFGELGYGTVGGASSSPGMVPGIRDAIDAAASEGDTCVLHRSGAVSCWGWHASLWAGLGTGYSTTPTAMPGIADAVGIALGHDHACAIHAGSGTVSCWGNNSDGQLGTGITGCADGSWDCAAPGSPALDLADVVQLGASYVHTCAVQASGQVQCFGWLATLAADGTVDRQDVLVPTAVDGLADAVQVSSSEIMDDADCASRSDGTVACWGWNSLGQFGSADAPDSVSPVTVPLP
jgi:alpha-tubulin suppressor-like RCC1 family protein